MEWTGVNELREKFLNFFETKEHLRLESFSLVPKNDPSLLLINSGMAPMKKYFTGEITPPKNRVVTCQKCVRTGDLESVGITARHGTFFEMLGNFSFGDYFKKEAISWAWEFCTKILKLPLEKLWITVYEKDEEALNFWNKEMGVPLNRIVKLGKKDNFWEHGKGPCGPCSEIYFDKGETYSCGSKTCAPGCDCDRYMEFWNLVFTEFDNDGNNNYTKLARSNIDTGMGLERLACIMQNVDNIFLVDTVFEILNCICSLVKKKYGENKKDDVSIRIIADHIRSIVFMVTDGVVPSNEDRGYVLRKLIRRAFVHGRLLGIKNAFLSKIAEKVVEQNNCAYQYLNEKLSYIKDIISKEESVFSITVNNGMKILNTLIKNAKNRVLSGEDAFKLTDTYGFPLDLAKEILSKYELKIDTKKYNKLLLNQKNMARNARKIKDTNAWETEDVKFNKNLPKTEFLGYEVLESKAEVLEIIGTNKDSEIFLIFDKSPFYAESGGQIGDVGTVTYDDFSAKIIETKKTASGIFLHRVKANKNDFRISLKVTLKVDEDKRASVSRNHTGAHLLHGALKKVLGDHVHQAGQLVNSEKIRFDFEHFATLKEEDIFKIEDLVNNEILKHSTVTTNLMSLEDAKKSGAMALFTEKYGDVVRVVKAGDFSLELCGGTHVKNTSNIGIFKITAQSAVSSGIRRIEAVTGFNALNYFKNCQMDITEGLKVLDSNSKNLKDALTKLNMELKNKTNEIKDLRSKLVKIKLKEILSSGNKINNIFTSFVTLSEDNSSIFKEILSGIKSNAESYLVILVNKTRSKTNVAVLVSRDLNQQNIFANDIFKKIITVAGGKGGGGKDFAMGTIINSDFKLSSIYSEIKKEIENNN